MASPDTWYLGFDISTSLGWNLRAPDGKVRGHGIVKLGPGHGGAALAENMRRISHLVTTCKQVVGKAPGVHYLEPAVEAVQFSSMTKAHASYWRVRTLLELVLHELLGTEVIELEIGVTELKTYAMGGKGRGTGPRGQVTKEQMVDACAARDGMTFPPFSYTPKGAPTAESKRSGDKADAAHVSHWAWTTDKG